MLEHSPSPIILNPQLRFLLEATPVAMLVFNDRREIVAERLAGMPVDVIARAREILGNLEEGELEAGQPKLARRSRRRETPDLPGQMTLFEL